MRLLTRAILLLFLFVLGQNLLFGTEMALGAGNDRGADNVILSVPRSMTYQGILKDVDGEPVPDSFFDVTFRLFSQETGGIEIWSQTIPDSTDATGHFTANLTDLDLPFDQDYWLEIEIGSEVLSPRQKISMVPYAARADTADYASMSTFSDTTEFAANSIFSDTADYARNAGVPATGWIDAGTVVYLDSIGDSVGIGTTQPLAPLHVESGAAGYYGSVLGRDLATNSYGYLGGSGKGVYGIGSTAGVTGINMTGINYGSLGTGGSGVYGYGGLGLAGDFDGTVEIRDNLGVDGAIYAGNLLNAPRLEIGQFFMNTGASDGFVLMSDADGNGTWQPANGVQGNGTANLLSKFIDASTIGNSQVFDNGNSVGIGTTSPGMKLDVNGDLQARGNLNVEGSAIVAGLFNAYGITVSQFQLFPGGANGYVLTSDVSGNGTWQPLNAIGGVGTQNYVPKFANFQTLTNSQIFDNGSNVGIGNPSPSSKLDVNGDIWGRGELRIDGSALISNAISANQITISQFQLYPGGSAGYVLTSDGLGNGTWQPLPGFVRADMVDQLQAQIDDMKAIIASQNEKIDRLESTISDMRNSGR